MQAPRLAPEKRIPKDLATFTELSKFLSENNIKLFSREDHTSKYDIINYHLEQNRNDDAFFIVDLGEILEQYKQWNTHLPRVKPFYAVKSCNNPMILKTLAVLGCGFHCSSKTEIVGVTDVDISCNKILFGNPVKDPGHIKFARSQNVDFMVFDNEVELYKIKLYHPYAKLILRIAIDQSGFSKKMSSKFGCPLSDVKNLLEKARSLEIEVVGVSFHVGDKNTDLTTWTKSIENAREVFNIGESMGMHMNLLNIGGGFPGTSKNTLLSFEDIARTVNEAIDKYFDGMEDLKIIAEPGRYFSAKSHVLVFNVIGKRKIVEENQETIYQYYMNDGIYGSFSCIMYDGANPQISVFNVRAGDKKYHSMLFGPTCDDMDIITRGIEIPELGVGEWCYVEDFGAYTQVSSSEFSGFTSKENYYVFMY